MVLQQYFMHVRGKRPLKGTNRHTRGNHIQEPLSSMRCCVACGRMFLNPVKNSVHALAEDERSNALISHSTLKQHKIRGKKNVIITFP